MTERLKQHDGVRSRTSIKFTVTFELDEVQARALDAMVGYGADAFLETFYKMGTHYMQPWEGGLRSLFKAVEKQVRPELWRIDRARKALEALDPDPKQNP